MLYAPQSEIDIGGSADWIGMIAGKIDQPPRQPVLQSDPNIKEPDITYAGRFQRTRYVECTGATASPPNASC